MSNLILTTKQIRRPWGWYEIITKKSGYWIKKISVLKGHQLSLQSHKWRSETWIVLLGQVTITKGDKKLVLSQGESIVIAKNELHRISAIKNSLILEIAFGRVLENDIIRFEDDYGRK